MKVKELKEVIHSTQSRDDGQEIYFAFDRENGRINRSNGILILISLNKEEVKKLDESISN